MPGNFARVRRNMLQRCTASAANAGRHFEQTPEIRASCPIVGQITRLSPRRNGFDSRRGRYLTFERWESCWMLFRSSGFLGDLPFPPPLQIILSFALIVERERDKERLEAKRRQDQLKKINEEEQEENRKKFAEMQSDLLELRDAHAKLRHTNEKLRRDKERLEKEREDWRHQASGNKRINLAEEAKMNTLLEQVDELMRLVPDLLQPKERATSIPPPPTPPLRLKGPKSKESSPSLERKEFKKDGGNRHPDTPIFSGLIVPTARRKTTPPTGYTDKYRLRRPRLLTEPSVSRQTQFQSTVQRLAEVAEELRKYQRLSDEERERDRVKRAAGFRR
ncbi:hypothetical protein PR048_013846 [Dryococelus australis]|uniref:Uncharacterized protein n=1 Tax=Dryococelus australis TaxID=614101 RepID=A0ABQ9HTC7_9NEOP|nr:hypothetical protein PR048_013846 [Dryococelus australis]